MARLALVLVAIALTGCAISPQSIRPVHSNLDLSKMSCAEIADEKARIELELIPLYAKQRAIHNNDSLGILLVGLPTSSIVHGSKYVHEIATLKGDALAVNDAITLQGCKLLPVKLPPKPKIPPAVFTSN